MAVTPVGNPYVESSDLVANYPGASEALAERIDIVGVNPFANAAARDAAIPSPVQGQMCSLNDDNKGYRYDGSAWILFSGAGDANFTNAATGTYTTGGINYKYITFTGSGELVLDKPGLADILVVGGAGGSGNGASGVGNGGGGGAGGLINAPTFYFPAAETITVTIGAGGAATTTGSRSNFTLFVGFGGGGGGSQFVNALPGGSGGGGFGGGGGSPTAGGAGTFNQGNAGATGTNNGGGGGGFTAVGAVTAGGAGLSSAITGAPVTYAKGGDGTGGVAGAANTGIGGSGNNGSGFAGGSGAVIVRVVV